MKSLILEMAKRFHEIVEESCEQCDRSKSNCVCNEDELEEQNVTGAIAGYNTPAAFAKSGKWKGKEARYESVNTPATYKIDTHQTPESPEEELAEKFGFVGDNQPWYNETYEYPSKHMPDKPAKHRTTDTTTTHNKLAEMMDSKYEQLIESYRSFSTGDPKTTPEQKVKTTIKEVAKKLQEIETLVNHTSRLKTESGLARTGIGSSADKALIKISERLTKIAERVRALGE